MASLEIKNIQKDFGAQRILKGINLDCRDGEFLVLVGPSGCGKSTLLNIVAGLEEQTSGDVRIGGQNVNQVSPKDRNIAMVFQSYALYPTMTVRENIEFGMEMRKVPKEERTQRTNEVARMLQMEHLLDRKPARLSGGQRQRVAMGRALVRKPEVFLFDEPLSNLDAQLRVEMRTEIKKLHQSHKITTVYVTHDQVEAMTLASRIAILRDGRLEQFADPQTLYDSPANMFVAGFIGSPAMNFIPATVVQAGDKYALEMTNGTQAKLQLPLLNPSPAIQAKVGSEVICGLRPENITAVSASSHMTDQYTAFTAHTEVVEPTGPDTMVFFKLGGKEVSARVKPADARAAGEAIQLRVLHGKTLVFDPATQVRL
ncbi:MAG: ABC transporter ATP-binding protein [Bdellovibrionales bacterium]|nr:ABC transporter ATP-binding protein [Bdellovibrionales bacterium]